MPHQFGHRMTTPSLKLGHRMESKPHQQLGSRVPYVHRDVVGKENKRPAESDLEKNESK